MKMEGEAAYGIKFPSVDWGGKEVAIEIHCDEGQILTKTGTRAQIGICVFSRKQITNQSKNEEFQR